MSHTCGVDSEIGRLRSVLVHRPGAELRRVTPRTAERLGLRAVPWVSRAQHEHDLLTQVLREQGVEVLYLSALLQDVLEYAPARRDAIASTLADPRLGRQLRRDLGRHFAGLDPEALAQVLVAGLAPEEFRAGRGAVYGLLDRHEFVIEPLPGLVFGRDASVWVRDAAVIASLASYPRRREADLVRTVYRHHPRFAAAACLASRGGGLLHGGDVLQLSPGVVAAGVGELTTPAGVERLACQLFDRGLARVVLAVPLADAGPGARLDAVCTVVDRAAVLMAPALAYSLRARVIAPGPQGLRVSTPRPLLEAAAEAVGAGALALISTRVDPAPWSRQQWDDGGNALAIGPGVLVCHERNTDTNARLEAAGVEVIRVPGSELSGWGGGPRALACPVAREPAATVPRPGAAEPAVPAAAAAPVWAGDLVSAVPPG